MHSNDLSRLMMDEQVNKFSNYNLLAREYLSLLQAIFMESVLILEEERVQGQRFAKMG